MAKSTAKSERPPWQREAPRGTRHQSLSPSAKRQAKASARKAGRPYPNLVDNMRVAAKQKRRRSA